MKEKMLNIMFYCCFWDLNHNICKWNTGVQSCLIDRTTNHTDDWQAYTVLYCCVALHACCNKGTSCYIYGLMTTRWLWLYYSFWNFHIFKMFYILDLLYYLLNCSSIFCFALENSYRFIYIFFIRTSNRYLGIEHFL